MQLEARALEPLRGVLLAVAERLDLRVAQRQAEQRQILGLALAFLAVELQAAGVPGLQDAAADIVAGLGEEAAAGLRVALGESGNRCDDAIIAPRGWFEKRLPIFDQGSCNVGPHLPLPPLKGRLFLAERILMRKNAVLMRDDVFRFLMRNTLTRLRCAISRLEYA